MRQESIAKYGKINKLHCSINFHLHRDSVRRSAINFYKDKIKLQKFFLYFISILLKFMAVITEINQMIVEKHFF